MTRLLRTTLLILMASLLVTACNKPAATATPPADDTNHIQQVVHDYLLAHPEILIEVSQKLQAQQMQKMQDNALAVIKQQSDNLFNDKDSLVDGNPNGDVTLVEFFDYQCVHCAHMYPVVQSLIANNKNLRVVLKEFPIFGEASQYAAAAVLAAQEQGKATALHDALFKSGLIEGKLTDADVLKLAKAAHINIVKLKQAMDSARVKSEISNNFQLAQALGLQGTPGFIVAPTPGSTAKGKTTFIPGASDQKQLQEAIDSAA